MRRFAIAALLIGVAGAAAPASAQYYGGGGGGYGPRYDYDPPPRQPSYGGGGYGRGYDPDYDRRGYGPPPQARRGGGGGGSICVTSRGSCPIGAAVPRNTPCGCEVPGFGYKRGASAG